MWENGEGIEWGGVFNGGVWDGNLCIVLKDLNTEIVFAILPGGEGVGVEGYMCRKRKAKRRWDYIDSEWILEEFTWHTNRILTLTEPDKYYSTMLFWDDKSSEFLCYYINFQIPFQRSAFGIDSLDLDLDLIVHPDL